MNTTIIKAAGRDNGTTLSAVAPLVVLPIAVYALFRHAPAWQLMWMLAFAIYVGAKWLTLAAVVRFGQSSAARKFAYLAFWPGMDARAFLDSRSHANRPTLGEKALAVLNLTAGLLLLFAIVPRLADVPPIVVGWVGMAGLVFVLHFGLFHVLSIGWRLKGIDAEPLMNFPILASSLGDFWGRRWNLAFRDLAFGAIFHPIVRRVGTGAATMAVFIASGVIHDLVISVPARGGWGGPTLYFTIQGLGLLIERSRPGKSVGLGKGVAGRLFCALVTVGPIVCLFHEPFVRHIILPTLTALGAL